MINLKKNDKVGISLKKKSGELATVLIGLGWTLPNNAMYKKCDLDVSVFGLTNGQVPEDGYMVCFANPASPCGRIVHSGDNVTGNDGADDAEQVRINLDDLPAHIDELSIVVTIYDAQKRGQEFGAVENAYIRLIDVGNDDEVIAMYKLDGNYAGQYGVQVGSFMRENAEWKFEAMGVGFARNLEEVARNFGVTVE